MTERMQPQHPLPRILVIDDQQSNLDSFAALLEPSESRTAVDDAVLDDLELELSGRASRSGRIAAIPTPRYDVRYALQGAEGVRACAAATEDGAPFAVAFVDIHMPPGMDGVETVAALWKDQPNLEVVLCTAYSSYSWHEILAALPHRDQLVILRKPFDPIEVRQLAACLSEKWRRGCSLARRMEELEAQVASEVARRLQVELARSQKFEALGRLAAGIAHEINTPAQYIQTNLEFIGEAFAEIARQLPAESDEGGVGGGGGDCGVGGVGGVGLREDIAAAITDALDGVARVTSIVRSVRDYAHTSHAQREPVDLNRQIRIAAGLARSEYKQVAELVLDLGEVPTIMGHADELGRAILNLVINATHAIHARREPHVRGRITVTSRAVAGGGVTIAVADTGVGIAAENRDRIFEPFFTTKALGQGTGQGLTIVRATVVDRHQGAIRFDSEPGKGTTFWLTFPGIDERAA